METQPLNQILGHRFAIEFLQNIIRFGPLGHTYLFHGPEGVGKETTAKRFAQILLCEKPTKDGEACDSCDSCHRYKVDTHPNFLYLKPEGRFNYKVEQIRDLRKNSSFTSYQGNRRVYLIPDADKMQPEGANAILKTLEEPGSGIVLILVTSNLLSMLPTIISRCQQVRFNRLSRDIIMEILQSKHQIKPEIAELTAHLSGGSPGKALELSHPAIQDFRTELLSALSKHTPNNLTNIFILSKKIMDLRKQLDTEEDIKLDIITIYDWLIFWFRDLLVYRITKDDSQVINKDHSSAIAAISSKWTWSALRSSIQQLEYLKYIVQKNISPQFTIETVFLRAFQSVL